MGVLKEAEIGFRKGVIRLLRLFVRRGKTLPKGIDFNRCTFLFVRQDRIGDVLVSTPLLHSLKRHYPDASVDFLLSTNNHFVLEHDPMVRNRWIYRKTLPGAIKTLFTIRRQRYDFVIDLMDNPSTTSTVICTWSGGQWTVGLSKENEYAYDITVPLLSRKETHIVDRLGRFLTVFGIDPVKEEFRIQYLTAEESDRFADQFFRDHKLLGRRVIGINISPVRGVRFWGRKNFQEALKSLVLKFPDAAFLVLSQPADREEAAAIAQPHPEILLAPLTSSFDRFAAIIRKLNLLLTPDTSAVHLAAAFTIPAVVLYVQSDKSLRIWEPYGSPNETLVTGVDDLSTIPVADVVAAVERLLSGVKRNESNSIKSSLRI